MKFSCEKCNAKYQISDDKVGPAGVKVPCKKCGHVMIVRRSAAPEAPQGVTSPGVEWWVAIDEQPVGPVGLEVVQHHWDQGEIGPESLVWYSGLAEWTPIGSVPELHGHLTGGHPPPHDLVAPPPPPQAPQPPAPEEEWRPGAASALAALEEPEPRAVPGPATGEPPAPADASPPPAEAAPSGTDPSGVRPLPMAGLERTGEKRLATTPGTRGPMARSPEPAGQGRTLPVVLLVALAVVAIVAIGLWWLTK